MATYRQDGIRLDETAIVEALWRFNDLWDALFPAEQSRIVRLLVDRVMVGRAGIAVDRRFGDRGACFDKRGDAVLDRGNCQGLRL
jgi:hypothetical protein